MHTVIISLGTNLGNKQLNLFNAIIEIKKEFNVKKYSKIYSSPPWQNDLNQDFFLNQILVLETTKNEFETLNILMLIENKMGRTRHKKWEARCIDLDILFFNDCVLKNETLNIPHLHLHNRNFILKPLVEMGLGGLIHPVFKKNILELLTETKDECEVKECT